MCLVKLSIYIRLVTVAVNKKSMIGNLRRVRREFSKLRQTLGSPVYKAIQGS